MSTPDEALQRAQEAQREARERLERADTWRPPPKPPVDPPARPRPEGFSPFFCFSLPLLARPPEE